MSCLTDGVMRAQLDGELNAEEREAVESHLASCPECRQRAAAITHRAKAVQTAFAALGPRPSEVTEGAEADPAVAWTRFEAQKAAEAERGRAGFFARLFAPRLRPLWAASALAAVAITLLSLAPARSWAQRILAMLRVQKIAVLPVDPDLMSERNPNAQTGKLIAQVLSDNVVVTESPGKPTQVASADAASQLAGFHVRALTGRSDAPRIMVQGEQAFHMTLNRDRLQSILNEAGRSDLRLPPAIDGAEIAVRIPKAVAAFYGSCPKEPNRAGDRQFENVADCVVLLQVPSPTVSVPPDLNVSQLAEAGLELAGVSATDAKAFCQTVDWTSTLVIPVPRTGNSYARVSVDGVQGTLINMPPGAPSPRSKPGFTLIWIRDGIIYSLVGMGNPVEAVPLAGTLD